MAGMEDLARRATPILERLVAFDTTSHLSNLALIAWVEGYLAEQGVGSRRIVNADGHKANLLATVGPQGEDGERNWLYLDGHVDMLANPLSQALQNESRLSHKRNAVV